MTADARPERPLFWVVPDSKDELAYALAVAAELRAACPTRRWRATWRAAASARVCRARRRFSRSPGRYAQRAGGVRAVLLGSREREDGNVTIKDLATGEQQTFPRAQLAERLGAGEGAMTPRRVSRRGSCAPPTRAGPCSSRAGSAGGGTWAS